jgi:opacity protein-like surface antigen
MKLNSKIFMAGILATTVTGAASANPVIDVYAGGMFGAGGTSVYWDGQHENESAKSFGAVVGIDIPLLRIEAEYNHITNDVFDTNDAMLNAYFKMMSTMIHPYFGLGVGSVFGGHADYTGVKTDVKSSVAYQSMLGLTFDILAAPIKFDIEGRVLYAPNFMEIGKDKPDMLQYDARLKLRYVF